MQYAIDLASKSEQKSFVHLRGPKSFVHLQCPNSFEVPVASVIAIGPDIISYSNNRVETDNIAWHHAEFLAIEKAINKLNTKYLDKASIYITLEPCILCSALLDRVRIHEIYFGSYSLQQSSLTKNLNLFPYLLSNTTIIGGLFDNKCFQLIKKFFNNLR